MKNTLKNILKYILIYVITVSILFGALVITSKIPKEGIYNNLKESAEYYRNLPGITRKSTTKENEMLHYYADSMLLNIMYHIDSDHPITSSMEARFYKKCMYDSNEDFVETMDEDRETNEQYIRYWHGSLSVLRPLMTVLNIQQIYILNNVVFWALLIALVVILFRKYKTLAVAFIIASIMIKIYIVPNCIEYMWTVAIMLIVSIISLLIEKKGNKNLYILYFITGIITCYFDFLSTETLTILIPVILTLLVRYKENRITGFKEGFKFVFTSCVLWFLSYGLMWFTKWILASVILKINAFEYVKDNALLRMNLKTNKPSGFGIFKTSPLLNMTSGRRFRLRDMKSVLKMNFMKLYPLNNLANEIILMLSILLFVIILLLIITIYKLIKKIKNKDEKKENEWWIKILLFAIGIIPYVRYLVMSNHSYYHSFFTYRAQMPSIIAIIFIIIYSIDKKIRTTSFKKIRNKKENK